MRRLLLIALLGVIGLVPFRSVAQVNVNINIGSQPLWGPVGYDHVDYYYLPDVESYYHVPKRQFVYLQNNNWVYANSLPSRYSGYDLYNGYKVVINSPTPYHYHKNHKVKYAKYKSNRSQKVIKYSNHRKYDVVKGKSKHQGNKNYKGGNGNGKGNNGKGHGGGHGKGNGKGNGNGKN
jgi:hypothetical protein